MKIDIYTDGACSGNPGPGGWGAMIYIDGSLEQELSGGQVQTTNNVMELTAPIMALSHLILLDDIENAKITIYSDSSYVVKSITEWAHKWIKNDFKGKANPDLMRQLYQLSHQTTLNVSYQWVKAHNGDPKNEAVDALARSAIVWK